MGNEARKLLLKSIGTMGMIIGAANIVSAKARGLDNEQAMQDALRSLNPTAGEFGSVAVEIPGVGSFRAGAAGQLKAMLSFLTEFIVQPEAFTGERRRSLTSPGDRLQAVRPLLGS